MINNESRKSIWHKSSSGYKIEISLNDWIDVGCKFGFLKSAMSKSAMPVMDPSAATQDKLKSENWGILSDINNTLSGLQKKELKSALESAGLSITGLMLPKVFRLKEENLVQFQGKPYYYLHHDIKGDRLWLLDPDTYSPIEMGYNETKDKLELTDDARRESVASKMNKAITSWNEKIEKLDKGVGLITIPLRVQRALRIIDSRLSELEGQKQGFEQREGGETEGMKAWEHESKEALKSGIMSNGQPFNEQDAIDTASFWYLMNKDIDGLLRDVNSFNLDPKIKTALINIANAERQKLLGKEENKNQKKEEWDNRLDTDALPSAEPNLDPVPLVRPEDLPQGSTKKPTGFNHPSNVSRQSYNVIKSINDQLLVLNNVKESLQGIQMSIKNVPSLTKDYLRSSDGQSFINELTRFASISKDFLRKYERDVFDSSGQVQRNIFNNTGGMGNSELIVELNRLYSAVEASLKTNTSPSQSAPSVEMQAVSKNKSQIIKNASGKIVAKLSFADWIEIGKKSSWIKSVK